MTADHRSPWWPGDITALSDAQLAERNGAMARATLLALKACEHRQVEQATIDGTAHYLELRQPDTRQDFVDAWEAWLETEEETVRRRVAATDHSPPRQPSRWSEEDLAIDLGEHI